MARQGHQPTQAMMTIEEAMAQIRANLALLDSDVAPYSEILNAAGAIVNQVPKLLAIVEAARRVLPLVYAMRDVADEWSEDEEKQYEDLRASLEGLGVNADQVTPQQPCSVQTDRETT